MAKTDPRKLIGDLIVVAPRAKPHGVTITLPDWARTLEGIALKVGPECTDVRVGDRVFFAADVGMEGVYDGEHIRIMRERNIDLVYG